ncbi:MAG TPA: lipid A-modifier LpxR family protein [Algoriphagus sp.]|nr:lipid A-modifier LpxR family protein [Algoriphagus sp.]
MEYVNSGHIPNRLLATIMKCFIILSLILILCKNEFLHAQDGRVFHQVQLSHDNDIFKFKDKTDRYYTFGLFIEYRTALKENNGLANLTNKLRFLPREKTVFSNELFVKGFTAETAKLSRVPSRPFAGVSGIKSTLSFSSEKKIWTLGTIFGVRGKISGAEWIQDSFHKLISSPIFEGWRHQLSNKFLYGLHGSFVKPVSFQRRIRGISQSNLTLGNIQIQFEQNLGLQIGIFNEIDQSSLFNNYINRKGSNKNEYYLIASVFGRAIATDATLTSDSLKQELVNPLNKRNLQAGYQVRIVLQTGRIGLNAGHTMVSTESNFSESHSYGSIGVSYSFR